MEHVVIPNLHECPKCKKMNSGAAVHLMDNYFSCPDCFYGKYEKELQPTIKKMIREYFDIPEPPK